MRIQSIRLQLSILWAVGTVAVTGQSAIAAESSLAPPRVDGACGAFEVAARASNPSEEEYRKHVCLAVTAQKEHKYEIASKHIAKAMLVTLFEQPNYVLYVRRAEIELAAGRKSTATDTLLKARLATQIAVGEYVCDFSGAPTPILRDRLGRPVKAAFMAEVVSVMCGEAFAPIYEQHSLASTVFHAKLIEYGERVAMRLGMKFVP